MYSHESCVRGGRNQSKNLTEEQVRINRQNAVNKRWEYYYDEHPGKMDERLKREKRWPSARNRGGSK